MNTPIRKGTATRFDDQKIPTFFEYNYYAWQLLYLLCFLQRNASFEGASVSRSDYYSHGKGERHDVRRPKDSDVFKVIVDFVLELVIAPTQLRNKMFEDGFVETLKN